VGVVRGRGRSLAILGGGAVAAVLVAAALVSQAPQHGEGWVALLQRKMGGTGWSRLPGHGVPTLWHEEPHNAAKASTGGWGRLPEQHKPRVRHAVPAKAKHHTTLEHELPAVYHLPSQLAVNAKVPAVDRLAAEKLARNLHLYHKQQVHSKRGLGQRIEHRMSRAKLRKEAQALPAGYHVLKPGQKLPKGAKIVQAPKLAARYHVLKPGMKLPKGAKIVAHPPKLAMRRGTMRRARMNVPRVGAANHMLDDEEGGEEGAEGGDCECEEGDEECECAAEEPRVANVTVVEPTADERLQIAFAGFFFFSFPQQSCQFAIFDCIHLREIHTVSRAHHATEYAHTAIHIIVYTHNSSSIMCMCLGVDCGISGVGRRSYAHTHNTTIQCNLIESCMCRPPGLAY
jgi:hypothetical protein